MNDNIFIRNPYLAMVMAIVVTLCGVLALVGIPVAQYPDVTPSQISVSVTYPGADAPTLLATVIEPLEKQINSAPGLIYLASTASDSGSAVITATFAIGTNAKFNLQSVQDRVNWATAQLPEPVQRQGVIVREQAGNILLGVSLYSPDGRYDTLFMSNYAAIFLRTRLERVPGVAQVMLFGGSEYAMRIWLDAAKCAALQLSVDEILAALRVQNLQISAGDTGGAPSAPEQRFSYTVKTLGRLMSVSEFADIIVRTGGDSAQVRLRDVARVELASEDYATSCTLNGENAVMLLVFPASGANGLNISAACRKLVAAAARDFPPGLEYGFQYDSTTFVRIGIRDVVRTLGLAVLLVSLVTLLFLGDWRMALIPTLAIPVSIVGSFAVLRLLGYSVNMVTLFALTLAIGIVVDDAIIVIENVSRLMDDERLSPADAAQKSMKQITGAVAATTAVLLAMFVPICFLPGITGELYRQFGVTLTVAVLLSACNALSLSPALSAILLKPHEESGNFGLFRWFNRIFSRIAAAGQLALRMLLRGAAVVAALFVIGAALTVWWYAAQPTGFIPEEDQGYFFAAVQLPPASALVRTEATTEKITRILRALPGVQDVVAIPGYDVLNSVTGSENAFVIAILTPWDERLRLGWGAKRLLMMAQFELYEKIPEALCMLFEPPAIPGIGMAGGFNFVLEERSGSDPARLAAVLSELLSEAMRQAELRNVFSAFSADKPTLSLHIDRGKALQLGVKLEAIDTLLGNIPGYSFVNEFNRFAQVYKVEVQGSLRNRADARDLLALYVPNTAGSMTPLASVATISPTVSASFLSRYNLRLSAQIQGIPAPGRSSGEAMAVMAQLGKKLPPDMSYEWTGMSYQEQEAAGRTGFILLLAVGFIFLFLAALYASWLLPLAVLPVIIPALAGALLFVDCSGGENNLYTQIGIVLLLGMACKTAILVVDFAEKAHREGELPEAAALTAARLRFRAVVMTGLAFVCGTLPLAFASGPGAASQRAIGVPVVGGMVGSILAGLLLAPLCFVLIARLLHGRGKSKTFGLPLLLPLGLFFLNGCYTPPAGGRLIDAKSMTEALAGRGDPELLAQLGLLTRKDAVRIALANNPDYRSAFAAITAAKLRYYQALGAYSPSLSSAVAVGQQLYSGNSGGEFPSQDNANYTFVTVQANWILFNGLLREFEVLAAQHERKLYELLSDNAKRVLTRAVFLAYDEIIGALARRRIAEADLLFQSQELADAEAKLKTGDLAISAVLNFRAKRNQAQMAVVRSKNRYEVARFALALLLGYPESRFPDTVTFEDTEAMLLSEGENMRIMAVDYYLDLAAANRPDLNAMRAGLQILRYRHYQSYSLYSPVISGFANYSFSNNSTQNSGNNPTGFGNFYQEGNSFNYGALATLTLFNGFIRYNQVRQTRALLDQAYLKTSDEWLKVMNEVRSAHTDFRYSWELLELARGTRGVLAEMRDVVRREYDLGDVEITRLNQVQDDFVKSEYELLEAEVAVYRVVVRLKAAAAVE